MLFLIFHGFFREVSSLVIAVQVAAYVDGGAQADCSQKPVGEKEMIVLIL